MSRHLRAASGSPTVRLVTAALVGTLMAGLVAVPSAVAGPAKPIPPMAGAVKTASDKTSALEARRVDRVPTPKLDWYPCFGYAECDTVQLPLDYDEPNGPTTEVAVLKVKARKPKTKIGTLFVNPGGPGGSSTELALAAPQFLGQAVLDRFDIVGVDPRGVGASQRIECFGSTEEQGRAYADMQWAFPWTAAQEKATIAVSRVHGKACASRAGAIAGSMSTAEVARDMDVMRRAVGDKKLSYIGFSYGTQLGQVYANLFPDRVRAMVIDGVIDPVGWAGTTKNQHLELDARLGSGSAGFKAVKELIAQCQKAREDACKALKGDPAKILRTLAARLKAKPVNTPDGVYTYDAYVSTLMGNLYDDFFGPLVVVLLTNELWKLATPKTVSPGAQATADWAAMADLQRRQVKRPNRGFPYDNSADSYYGVMCSDGLHPKDVAQWPAFAAKADVRAPHFGRPWAYASTVCARNVWTAHDEDAYRGPFNRRTSAPVLIVGNYWDTATSYEGAVAASKLLPNSRLLSSDNWGHTAYGKADCVTSRVDKYLLTVVVPAKGTVCKGKGQPFKPSAMSAAGTSDRRPLTATSADLAVQGLPAAGDEKFLPPVVPPIPVLPIDR
jgi:pimeloyl-ACP methyl ester carboxylesterase